MASDEQFSCLEALFNQFYKWYVPKKVVGITILPEFGEENDDKKLLEKTDIASEDFDHKFSLHVNRLLNISDQPWLNKRHDEFVQSLKAQGKEYAYKEEKKM